MPSRYRDTRQGAHLTTQSEPKAADTTVIYCRISLDAEGKGLGVQRQEDECRQLCAQRGWDVTAVLVDNDISATTGKRRPQFEELLASKPTRIVVWHTDRLVRVSKDLERVIDLGVPVHAVTAGDLDLATPAGQAVGRTITAWATYEGQQKGLRQKASHRQRANAGKSFWAHRRPFGFTPHGEHEEREVEALRHCFAMLREGETFAACAAYLNGKGFTTTRGERWDGSKLSRTMRHPRNAGLATYGDEIKGQAAWSPVVPEEEWRAVLGRSEAIAASRPTTATGDRVKSLLGGIATCAECGALMKRTRQKSNRKAGAVYTVIYRATCPPPPPGEHGHAVTIDAEFLDGLVAKAVKREASRLVWVKRSAQASQTTPDQAQEAASTAVKLRRRLEDLSRREAMDELTEAEASAQREVLRSRLSEAEKKAATFYSQSPLDRADSQRRLIEAWDSMTLTGQREAVVKYLSAVKVRPRLSRNERASADMVTIEPTIPRTPATRERPLELVSNREA
ncbi:recombinase family protein [Terrabacter terrigena]|uniref:Recombinase family protein n=1 Tax=Terrabacter terrigena TaxID=574718 RepID=A0ABW3MYQ1_9MICO